MNYDKRVAMGAALLEKHGLREWSFRIENLQNTKRFSAGPDGPDLLGGCAFDTHTIYVDSSCPERDFRQTVLHEIAHALRGNVPGHDREWLSIAEKIGCTLKNLLPYGLAQN